MTEETYNMLEEAVQVQLQNVSRLEPGTKEGKEALARSNHLVELLIATDKDNADYYDKEEKRRIEEERNKAMIQTERDKQKITWGRAALEMSKVVVPTVLTMIGYNVFQKRVMKFEETGRITSTAGRDLHLPKFTK